MTAEQERALVKAVRILAEGAMADKYLSLLNAKKASRTSEVAELDDQIEELDRALSLLATINE